MSNRRESASYRYWTDEEVNHLAQLSKTHTSIECAQALGRSLKSVKQAALVRGFSFRKNPRKAYSTSDDDFIRKSVGNITLSDIANHLGRSLESVKCRVRRLGLVGRYRQIRPVKYSDDDVELCRQLSDAGLTPPEISDKMEIPQDTVRSYINFNSRLEGLPDYIYDISEIR